MVLYEFTLSLSYYCMKSVPTRRFSGPYFPAFRLSTDIYSVSLRIQSECAKIRTRKTPNANNFHVAYVTIFILLRVKKNLKWIRVSYLWKCAYFWHYYNAWIFTIMTCIDMSTIKSSHYSYIVAVFWNEEQNPFH